MVSLEVVQFQYNVTNLNFLTLLNIHTTVQIIDHYPFTFDIKL